MSVVTQIIRATGHGGILNAIEAVERAVGIHTGNPTPETAAAVTTATITATSAAAATRIGSVIAAVDSVAAAVGVHLGNPSAETAGAVTAATTAATATTAAAPAAPSALKSAETATIDDLGNLLKATFTTKIASKLGPAATISESVASTVIDEFDAFLEARLPA